jgi:hypothetical protein
MLRQAPDLPLNLPMPCQRLAVKDAAGAAQRAKLLDREGHGHTVSRAARQPRPPSSVTPAACTALTFPLTYFFSQSTLTHRAAVALPAAIPASITIGVRHCAGSGVQLVLRGSL